MPLIESSGSSGGGGGSGTVTNVSSADTSIVVTNPTTTPSLKVGTMDVLFTNEPPAAAVPMNTQKLTGLAAGTTNGDSVRFEQVVKSGAVTAADTSIVVAGTGVAPTIATGTLDVIATNHPPAAAVAMNTQKLTGLAAGTTNGDSVRFEQVVKSGAVTAADTSIVVAGTGVAPTIATGTLDVIATNHPPAAAVAMNAKKITGLAVATAATDAASLANSLDQFATPAANVPWNAKKITGLANGTAATDAAAFGQIPTGLADPLAVGLGYVNWNYNPLATASGASAVVSGTVYCIAVWLPFGKVVTNVVVGVATAAAGTNPTGFFAGIAGPTGSMLAQSGNLAAAGGPTATGPNQLALGSTYTPVSSDSATGLFFIVLLQNGSWGTTQPTFVRGTPSGSLTTFKPLGANPPLGATGVNTGQTALPANGSGISGGIAASAAAIGFFVATS